MMLMMSLFAGHQEDGPGEEADAGEEAEGGQEDGPGEEVGDGQEDGQESPRAEQSGLVRGVGIVFDRTTLTTTRKVRVERAHSRARDTHPYRIRFLII